MRQSFTAGRILNPGDFLVRYNDETKNWEASQVSVPAPYRSIVGEGPNPGLALRDWYVKANVAKTAKRDIVSSNDTPKRSQSTLWKLFQMMAKALPSKKA